MLQVAAYCRVSTDKEDQANSFEAQQRYFREYIQRQPDWELQGIYADEGFSGTSTNKRVEFNKMLHAAELGQIDLIVTKEVSRFTRNTVDALQITRELRRRGVGVLFLNDSLDTRTNDGELRLTIMSSFAQDESRRTSERSKWGQMRREYLRQARPILFSDMVLSETLYEHCAEVEATAKSRMELIVPQLMKHYGVTEQLKAENQMEWVRQLNACVAQAEETIKAELIYC